MDVLPDAQHLSEVDKSACSNTTAWLLYTTTLMEVYGGLLVIQSYSLRGGHSSGCITSYKMKACDLVLPHCKCM